jgi:hypothetical protein
MSKIQFNDGTIVDFQGTPTTKDVEEVANKLGIGATSTGTTPLTTTATAATAPPSSLLSQIGGFFKGEITGQPEKAGILGDIFQTTLGSKGLLGILQMPGRVAAQPGVLQTQAQVSQSQGDLANMTTQLIKQSKTITDPTRKAKINQMIQDNMAQIQQMGGDVSQLQKAVVGPKEALATAARAGLTVAPFALGGEIKAAETALGVPQIGGGLAGAGARIGARAAESGLISAGFGGATAFGEEKTAKEIAQTAASYGITGAVLGGIIQTGAEGIGAIRNALMSGAERIQLSRLSPRQAEIMDVNASSKEEATNILKQNIDKYGLYGNAYKVCENAETQLSDLNLRLKSTLTGSEGTVNLGTVMDETERAMEKDTSESIARGEAPRNLKIGLQKMENVFQAIKQDVVDSYGAGAKGAEVVVPLEGAAPGEAANAVSDIANQTDMDLVKANSLKRLAGTSGAYEYGRADPDATAKERVWDYFYTQMRKSIEDADPGAKPEIQQINKQMQDILPIYRMALRRIPAEAKAAPISVKTMLGLGLSFVNPSALTLVGLDIAQRSGRLAGLMSGAGNILGRVAAPSAAGVIAPSMIMSRMIERLRGQPSTQSATTQSAQERLNQLIQQNAQWPTNSAPTGDGYQGGNTELPF